ncbi:hypothetical protein FQV39_28825 [Bosea sp. F3-2]|uniref:hypothetical protein n=1 Tax=Bosea sp. F3-2 TaxID=2599640 RepID=UPI0011EF69A4|nr:hypothetical protein [Bosea sp. F3-2]QEL26168.1 hypothetical protein FQV39_28825 [Bosea sp. F3-2]
MGVQHLNKPLDRQAAEATVRAVERAIEGGAAYPVARGQAGRSALVEAAAALGLAATTVRNRLEQGFRLYGLKPNGIEPPERASARKGGKGRTAAAEPDNALQRKLTGLQDEVTSLRKQLKAQQREDLDTEAVRLLLGRISAAPSSPPRWTIEPGAKRGNGTPEVPVTVWSDWHIPEVVSLAETAGKNEYNPEIAEARVRRLVASTISLARKHGPGDYPGIVVNLLGDFVSGGLHPELAKTDAEEVLPSVLRCVDLLIWGLRQIADAFGHVYVPCTSGNHGRATQKPEFKRYIFKNYDWLIYQLVARAFEGDRRLVFDIPDTNEVHYRVFGQRYLAMHGDMLGVKGGDGIIGSLGPIARGETKVGKQAAALGQDYDVLVIGHWHQMIWLPRVIVSNTLKGWDEYARSALRAPPTPPSQPLWFVHPRRGITSRWEIRVDEPGRGAGEEWVSFRRAA